MKKVIYTIILVLIINPTAMADKKNAMRNEQQNSIVTLTNPEQTQEISLETVLKKRRSIRHFSDKPMTLNHASLLLWAAQGITNDQGFRTAPSAGALYPITIYLLANNVQGLDHGLYSYEPITNALHHISNVKLISKLSDVAYSQQWIDQAPLIFIITAKYEITATKYGNASQRFVHIEAGSIAQNIYLQATALNLGVTMVGALYDKKIQRLLGLETNQTPLGIMPVGHP